MAGLKKTKQKNTKANITPKMVNPRDKAGNVEEEEEERKKVYKCSNASKPLPNHLSTFFIHSNKK